MPSHRANDLAQGLGGTAFTANDAASVLWVHHHFDGFAAAMPGDGDINIIRIVDNPADKVRGSVSQSSGIGHSDQFTHLQQTRWLP